MKLTLATAILSIVLPSFSFAAQTVVCKPTLCLAIERDGSESAESTCRYVMKNTYTVDLTGEPGGQNTMYTNANVTIADPEFSFTVKMWDLGNLRGHNIWNQKESSLKIYFPEVKKGETVKGSIMQSVNNAVISMALADAECTGK